MSWICSNCSTNVESSFKVCWKCGTDVHGNIDENFAAETEPDEVSDDPETPRIQCEDCGYRGKVLFLFFLHVAIS